MLNETEWSKTFVPELVKMKFYEWRFEFHLIDFSKKRENVATIRIRIRSSLEKINATILSLIDDRLFTNEKIDIEQYITFIFMRKCEVFLVKSNEGIFENIII